MSAVDGPLFLSADAVAQQRFLDVVATVAEATARWSTGAEGPDSGVDPAVLAAAVDALDVCPAEGAELDGTLGGLGPLVLANGVQVSHPRCAAHLHCPTLVTAAAAEVAVGATNQSMDSYDQAPAATLVEDRLVRWLAELIGFPPEASGVLTSGGTRSNLLGLLLARDRAARRAGVSIERDGLPEGARSWRIVTSEAVHFSVRQAAAVLGLGHRAVVAVPVDDTGRMDLDALDAVLTDLRRQDLPVVAVVATAGTTDAGAVDPLAAVAARAEACGAWFHVDAAVGAALALSDTLRPHLDGIDRADSVTADLHKLWWQPIGVSALLVRDLRLLEGVGMHSDYLHRPQDEAAGVVNLVARSIDTSRRFDALKVVLSLRATGRRRMAAMVEHVVALAAAGGCQVAAAADLELLAPPSTVTVLFRWRPGRADLTGDQLDRVNTEVQQRLLASGRAVIGRTRHRGSVALKLTFVNPLTTVDDVAALLDLVVAEAGAVPYDAPP